MLFGGTRSDMYIAGYAFRLFGAETFRATGSIPEWNPYLFGGLPFIGAMHGDMFYPTAWLRWIVPVDIAITWGMVVHFVLAGWFMYRLCRALGLSWSAGLVAGVAYEFTGIVASQMSPGHDGKLFVSALAPLAFWTLLHAIRRGRTWAFGAFACEVALIILGHYHMAYFLLLALGLWTLYLTFWDTERVTVNAGGARVWTPLGMAALAVALGVGITALQVMPFVSYIPFSPRGVSGPDQGWSFATSYALPPSEVFTLLLPEFNGVLDGYWGRNPLKFHTEYVGFLPLALAALALGDRPRRRLVVAFAFGAVFFLLLSFGGHTPFYRPFFELLPGLKKIRAMGMVFYLSAFALCVLAGIGTDRVLNRGAQVRTVLVVVGAAALFAVLGAVGALEGVATSLAIPERLTAVSENAPGLQAGALRLLLFVALGGALLWAAVAGRLAPKITSAMLVLLVAVELWSVDRRFFNWSPRASVLFADDAVTRHLRGVSYPYRVLDAGQSYGHSHLMTYGIPQALGYHGFQLQRYNELGGAAEGWRNLLTPSVLDLLAIRYIILREAQEFPGYHVVVPQAPTAFGTTAVLYERDTLPAYARVVASVAKGTDAQVLGTLADPRFPGSTIALISDSAATAVPTATQPPFPSSRVTARVSEWRAGSMTIRLDGSDVSPSYLVVSENWYPDWHAEVDGRPGTVRRVDHSLIGVELPPKAREVKLRFASPAYAQGKIISGVSLLGAVLLMMSTLVRTRTTRVHAS